MSITKYIAAAAVMIGCGAVWAQGLRWDRTAASVAAGLRDMVVTAEFPFVNASDRVLTVLQVQVSCGCFAADLPVRTFAPGAGDRVVVRVPAARKEGVHNYTITVVTDDPDHDTDALHVEVKVPELVRLSSPALRWKAGDTAPQTVTLTVVQPDPIAIQSIAVVPKSFTAECEVIEAGRDYRITLTPREGTKPGTVAQVTILTDAQSSRVASIPIAAVMDRPPGPKGSVRSSSIRKPSTREKRP